MTPEERAQQLWDAMAADVPARDRTSDLATIAAAFRAAENDAIERARTNIRAHLEVVGNETLFPAALVLQTVLQDLDALKHPGPKR